MTDTTDTDIHLKNTLNENKRTTVLVWVLVTTKLTRNKIPNSFVPFPQHDISIELVETNTSFYTSPTFNWQF